MHALELLHRFLRPDGILAADQPARIVDLRNRRTGLSEIDCVGSAGRVRAGYLKRSKPLADFRAADRALHAVIRQGLFTLQAREVYLFRYYFRSLAVLDRVLSTQWSHSVLETAVRRRIQALMLKSPAVQIVVIERIRLSVLRKI